MNRYSVNVLLFFGSLSLGCSSYGVSVPQCVPGKAETCSCSGSVQHGTQTCLPSGTYGPCNCVGSETAPVVHKPNVPDRITPSDIAMFVPNNVKYTIDWEGDLGKDNLPEAAVSYEIEVDYGPESAKSGGTVYAILLGYRNNGWTKIWNAEFPCDSGGASVKWDMGKLSAISTTGMFTVLFDASCRDTDTLTQYTLEANGETIKELDKAVKMYVGGGLEHSSGKYEIVEKDCEEWGLTEIEVAADPQQKVVLDWLSKPDLRVIVTRNNSVIINSGVVKDSTSINYPVKPGMAVKTGGSIIFTVFETDISGERVIYKGEAIVPSNRHEYLIHSRGNGVIVTFWVQCWK
jgi:hypothetical protein